eukprot:10287226-Ditylum_brightwellii.AAC.1
MASDGSSDNEENAMTFGWKIVDENKDPLVDHSGPVFGKATSFYTEGYGLLSLAQFLHHGKIYTQTKIQCYIETHINNKGIVKQMKDQISYSHDYPFNTLESDWDIIAQVAVTLCSYRSRLTMFHVKSHQDNDKDEEDLDLPAYLSVAADNLATIFCIQYDQPLPLVPQVAVNSVQLRTMD